MIIPPPPFPKWFCAFLAFAGIDQFQITGIALSFIRRRQLSELRRLKRHGLSPHIPSYLAARRAGKIIRFPKRLPRRHAA